LNEIAIKNKLALIVDEVFADYPFADDKARARSTAGNADVLTFTLNGISKSCGLPQLKLGWIVTSGKDVERNEALQRMEIIADTFLSVNTPVQVALPKLLRIGREIRGQIRKRLYENYFLLRNVIAGSSPLSLLEVEAGWYAILKIPNTRSEEEWVLRLLDEGGVHVFPGYFFEFVESGYLVLSLLAEPASFEKGITHLRRIVT
jgi:aspartate/methionine/tyrosine aminotransferase